VRAAVTRCARRLERAELAAGAEEVDAAGGRRGGQAERAGTKLESLAREARRLRTERRMRSAAAAAAAAAAGGEEEGGGLAALRGGGGVDWQQLLPSQYASTLHWLLAMLRILFTFVLTRLGVLKPASPLAALAQHTAVPPEVLKALESASFKEEARAPPPERAGPHPRGRARGPRDRIRCTLQRNRCSGR